MIYGTGIDLVENHRIEKIIQKWGEKFLSRVFTDREIAYCSRHAHASIHYGARFAAKESFLKALGIGLGAGVQLKEIEVIHSESGKPVFILHGAAKERIETEEISEIHLSLTHTEKFASAFVLLEKK